MSPAESTSNKTRQGPFMFGFHLTNMTAKEIGNLITDPSNLIPDRARLLVTPNIMDVVLLYEHPDFRRAYDTAEIIVPDGFPVLKYARLLGYPFNERITGHDIFNAIMDHMADSGYSLFIVTNNDETVDGFRKFWDSQGLSQDRLFFHIPPFGFENDAEYCSNLAAEIRESKASILVMGLGPPKSAVFIYKHLKELPGLWAVCIGSAVNVLAGTSFRCPEKYQRLHLEWLYRLSKEPKRLWKRYFHVSRKYPFIMLADYFKGRKYR
jgi:N-acetylglucosaminyldiphosphoundecaprenol N-acetyl-beta-D-mannosaminyltransferase